MPTTWDRPWKKWRKEEDIGSASSFISQDNIFLIISPQHLSSLLVLNTSIFFTERFRSLNLPENYPSLFFQPKSKIWGKWAERWGQEFYRDCSLVSKRHSASAQRHPFLHIHTHIIESRFPNNDYKKMLGLCYMGTTKNIYRKVETIKLVKFEEISNSLYLRLAKSST